MTVAAELAKGAQQLEYFVTIEGVGWPANGLAGLLSGGFNGDIFCTNDISGDLDAQLQGTALTVHHGLELSGSISESVDPRNAKYTPSGISFSIVDHDDTLREAITPRKSGPSTTLLATHPLTWQDPTPWLTNGAAFDAGDLVWVGGRELIKLGTKVHVAGSAYRYTSSTRGYLGTQRGSSLRRPEDYCLGHWPAETTVHTVPWWWFNRQVALWCHVPGEAATNCQLVWYGRLRPIKNPSAGIEYSFNATGDFISTVSRTYRAIDWQVQSTKLAENNHRWTGQNWLYAAAEGSRRLLEFSLPGTSRFGSDGSGLYELAAAYQYRNAPGGLEGMVTSWDAGGVQARDIGTEADILYSYVWADDSAWLMYHRHTEDGETRPWKIAAHVISQAGKSRATAAVAETNDAMFSGTQGWESHIAPHTAARFLLDNMQTERYAGRFNLWGSADGDVRHTRHPVDVALMFMLSTDRELDRGDTAAGSTSTVVNFTTNAPDDALIGKALFCMEGNGGAGTASEMEACPITDNDSTSATIEGGFSAAPNAAIEVQVRNSIYDLLPLGWGMGIDSNLVDVDSFERVRDEAIPDASLGDFILGVQDEIDIWQLIEDYIFKPYGIFVYFDYTTRKITAKYLGVTPTDGVFEDFVAINREHIYNPGNVTHVFVNPVSQVSLTTRSAEARIVGSTGGSWVGGAQAEALVERKQRASMMDGKVTTTIIKSDELNAAFGEHHLDRFEVEALLNTDADDGGSDALAGRLCGMIGEYSVPPPVWETELDIELYQSCSPGTYVLINWNETGISAPANPFTGNRGWTDIIGRVIGRSFPLIDGPSFPCTIELLTANLTARVVPAVVVTGKAGAGATSYFQCATTAATQNYAADPDNDKDWYKFAVGDTIEHRDKTGAIKAAWTNRSITGFGTNNQADPVTAPGSPMRIYLDGAIGSVVAAGDYITLESWPSSASSRRQRYSSYADASEELGPDGDPARVYA